ncbi:MAG: hypothetical protein OES59_01265, partial [Gammaproteobacteria bacterium]|nr:hypothetical protein [Gammaproteobacteria bacterium]
GMHASNPAIIGIITSISAAPLKLRILGVMVLTSHVPRAFWHECQVNQAWVNRPEENLTIP